jgi:hypothetical protein
MNTQKSFAYCEAVGKSKVWAAYAEYFACVEILEEGFNPNSGYVYLYLEIGVTIASLVGGDVEFIVYNEETDGEMFFDSYQELEQHWESAQQG